MSSRFVDVLSAAMIVFALAGMQFAVIAILRRVRLGPRRLCPGPRVRWWSPRTLVRFAWRPCCGYDLGQARAAYDGPLGCPECGRQDIPARQLLRSTHRLRLGWLGAIMLGIAFGFLTVGNRAFRDTVGGAARIAPTGFLLAAERALGAEAPLRCQAELRRRFDEGELTVEQWSEVLGLVVRDLRNDRVPGNSEKSIGRLRWLGTAAWSDLVPALRSDDRQQRRLAAMLLVERDAPPVPDLVAVLIDLFDDAYAPPPQPGRARRPSSSIDDGAGERAVGYVARHFDKGSLIRTVVSEALRNGSPAQRFAAAVVVGQVMALDLAAEAIPMLVSHLTDNAIEGDAEAARWALEQLGCRAWPALCEAARSGDAQQRSLAARVLRNQNVFLEPEGKRASLARR